MVSFAILLLCYQLKVVEPVINVIVIFVINNISIRISTIVS